MPEVHLRCHQCYGWVSDEEWAEVKAKFPLWSLENPCCMDCMTEVDDGATEYEKNLEIQAMITKALDFIGDFGAEAWNTVVEEVVKQAK